MAGSNEINANESQVRAFCGKISPLLIILLIAGEYLG